MLVETIYYLIQPRETLLDLLQTYQIFRFRSPTLWQKEEGGSRSPTAKEYSLMVKLIFIAEFRSDLLRLNYENKQQLLDHMMGTPPFTVETFDKWWNLERISQCLKFPDDIIRVEDSQFDLLASTGISRVDNLISKIRERFRQDLRFKNMQDKLEQWQRRKDDNES